MRNIAEKNLELNQKIKLNTLFAFNRHFNYALYMSQIRLIESNFAQTLFGY